MVMEDATDGTILVAKGKSDDDATDNDEYVVGKIVGSIIENKIWLYRVRWYGYTRDDNNAKLAEKIPGHFIDWCWLRQIVGRTPQFASRGFT